MGVGDGSGDILPVKPAIVRDALAEGFDAFVGTTMKPPAPRFPTGVRTAHECSALRLDDCTTFVSF